MSKDRKSLALQILQKLLGWIVTRLLMSTSNDDSSLLEHSRLARILYKDREQIHSPSDPTVRLARLFQIVYLFHELIHRRRDRIVSVCETWNRRNPIRKAAPPVRLEKAMSDTLVPQIRDQRSATRFGDIP